MTNHRVPATGIQVPEHTRVIAVESWDVDDYQQGIIWERTHADDGEWGEQLVDWTGDLDDALIRLREAGFELSEPIEQTIEGEVEAFIIGARS